MWSSESIEWSILSSLASLEKRASCNSRSAFTRNVYASFEIRSSGRATFWAWAEREGEREQSRRRSHQLGMDRAGPNCSEINPRDHFENFAALSFPPHLCSEEASLKSFRRSRPPVVPAALLVAGHLVSGSNGRAGGQHGVNWPYTRHASIRAAEHPERATARPRNKVGNPPQESRDDDNKLAV